MHGAARACVGVLQNVTRLRLFSLEHYGMATTPGGNEKSCQLYD